MTVGRARRPVDRAYLLAGRARRLPGKFLLPIEGEPLVAREVRILRSSGVGAVVVSVDPLQLADVDVVLDRWDAGPLGGLATVLERTAGPFFLFGADMPFLEPSAIETMRARFDGRTLVPRSRTGHLAVLHAIYSGVTIGEVRPILARGGGLVDLVRALARRRAVRFLPPGVISERSLTDVDTPADLARAEKLVRGPRPRALGALGNSEGPPRERRPSDAAAKAGKLRSK